MRHLVFCSAVFLMLLANVAAAQTIGQAARDCEGPNPDQAIAGCAQVLAGGAGESTAKRVEAYVNRGKNYYHKRDFIRALTDLNEAIRLDSNSASAYRFRGITYHVRAFHMGDKADYARALADYDAAIRINPHEPGAYLMRGNVYSQLGDNDRAIADYSAVIARDPKDYAGYYNRGHALFKKGDMVRAIPDLTDAIRLDPKSISAIGFRAIALSRQGDTAAALRDADELGRIFPNAAQTHRFRGDVFKALRRRDDAIKAYQKALTLKPDDYTKKEVDAALKELGVRL